jgi:hypothetical protein
MSRKAPTRIHRINHLPRVVPIQLFSDGASQQSRASGYRLLHAQHVIKNVPTDLSPFRIRVKREYVVLQGKRG